MPHPDRAEIDREIDRAATLYCPRLPADNFVPLSEILLAALHAMRRAARIERAAG